MHAADLFPYTKFSRFSMKVRRHSQNLRVQLYYSCTTASYDTSTSSTGIPFLGSVFYGLDRIIILASTGAAEYRGRRVPGPSGTMHHDAQYIQDPVYAFYGLHRKREY